MEMKRRTFHSTMTEELVLLRLICDQPSQKGKIERRQMGDRNEEKGDEEPESVATFFAFQHVELS